MCTCISNEILFPDKSLRRRKKEESCKDVEAICIPLIVKSSLFSFFFSFFLFRLKSTIDLRKRFFFASYFFFLRSVRVSVVRIINRGGELAVVMTWNYMALSLGDSYNPFLHSMVQSVALTFTRDDMPLFCLIRLRNDNPFRRKKSLPSFSHFHANRCCARPVFLAARKTTYIVNATDYTR